jgi:fumarate hydratase class II
VLERALRDKAAAFDPVVKLGRTHLMDAVPVRLGQEFSGYAQQVTNALRRVAQARPALAELPLGGTAVGTGLGAEPSFAPRVIAILARESGLPFVQAPNLFEALAARDGLVEASGALRVAAVSLTKVANDVRWLGSGPRGAIGEVHIPDLQPGSSIMPGKVNPVMSEMLLMVCAQVIGHDATIAWGGAAGTFELNVMIPVMAYNFLSAVAVLAHAVSLFAARCVEGLAANEARATAFVEQSLAMATALTPRIGYDAAAALAHEAAATGMTVRALCLEKNILPPDELDRLLDARRMTGV